MKDSDKIKNSIIDEFYNEHKDKVEKRIEHSDEDFEFKTNLNSAVEKMDVLNEDIFNFQIDTLSIIEKGESIRENKKANKEFVLFIFVSFIILSLYILAIIKIGAKLLIISQIIIVIILPWIGMAAMAIKRNGSEI